MYRLTLTRSAARVLATLRSASDTHPVLTFGVGDPAVRDADLPVETVRVVHPGLPEGHLTVDEADVIELCDHHFLTPLLDDRLAVTRLRLCAADHLLA